MAKLLKPFVFLHDITIKKEKSMIIDFHTHIFPEKIAGRVAEKLQWEAGTAAVILPTAECLLASMQEAGVDLSVILPVVTAPRQTETINTTALLTNEQYRSLGLHSFGGIHPDDDNYRKTLRWIASHDLKGIKLHPVYQGVPFDDIRTKRIISYAEELGLIIQVHAGPDIGVPGDQASAIRLLNVIEELKPSKLVLAHMGCWSQYDLVLELLAGQKCYLDTAFALRRPYRQIPKGPDISGLPDLCSDEQFVRIMKKHGAHRILFATDSPWSSQSEQVALIRSLPITEEEKTAILGANAYGLLNGV